MEKKTLKTADWLKSAFLLVVMLISSLSASAVTTEELSLGELTPGTTYSVGVNTHVTGSFTAPSDGTIVLTSSVDANTNLVPYSDADYLNVISTVRDDVARTKTFDALSGTTYYFAQTTSPTTSFDVVLTFTPAEEPGGELNAVYSPDPSVPVESLTEFTISFPDVQIGALMANGTVTILKDGVETTSESVTLSQKNNNVLIRSKYGEITNPGVYTFKIPANSITIYTMTGDVVNVPALEVSYTIGSAVEPEPEPGELNVTFSPDPAVAVESLQNVVITFPDYADKYVSATGTPAIYDANGNAISSFGTMNSGMGSATMYIIPSAITAAGTYTIKFTEGSFSVDGVALPAFEVTYTVGSAVEPEPGTQAYIPLSVDPADGSVVESISTITLTFSSTDIFKSTTPVVVYNSDREEVASAKIAYHPTIYEAVQVTFYPAITANGEYTVVFPSGSYKINGNSNPNDLVLSYTVEGAVEPEPEPGELNVTFSPDPAVAVESLSQVNVAFNDYSSVYIANQGNNAKLYKDGSVVEGVNVSYSPNMGWIALYISPAVTEAGVYTIKVPEGDLMAMTSPYVQIPAFEVSYTIEAKQPELWTPEFYSITPAPNTIDGPVIETLLPISLRIDNSVEADPEIADPFAIKIYKDDDFSTPYATPYAKNDDSNWACVNLTPSNGIYCNEAGKYTVVFPAGAFKWQGQLNAEFQLVYYVGKQGADPEPELNVTFSPDPTTVVESLEKIDITFNDYAGYYMITNSTDVTLYKDGVEYTDVTLQLGTDMGTGYIVVSPAITESGEYKLVVAENVFGAMNLSNYKTENLPGFEVTYTVEAKAVVADPVATWSIEEGSVVESFESVTVTFEGVEAAKATSTYSNLIFYKVAEDGTATLVENYCTAGYMDTSASGNVVTYTLDLSCYSATEEPYNVSGNYRIIIPAGGVYFNGDKENKNAEEYVLNFTIEGEDPAVEIDATFTADPANNSTVSEIREIVLTFTDYSEISLAELDLNNGSNIPYVYTVDDLTGSMMPAGYMFFEPASASNAMRLYVPVEYMGAESYTVEGSYKIRIPAGVVTFADGVSKEIILNYTVKAGGTEEPVAGAPIAVSPESGSTVESLSEITLSFGKDYYPGGVNYDFIAVPKVYNAEGEVVEVTASWAFDWSDFQNLIFKLNPALTEAGTYTIKFPAGAVKDFEDMSITSPAFELTYTIEENEPEPVKGAPIKFNPEAGSTVGSIYTVGIHFNQSDYPGGIDITYFGTPEVYKDGELISTSAYYDYDSSDWWLGYVKFTTPLTESGEYTIKVPAGHFYEYGYESNAAPAFEVTYTVEAAENTNPGPISVDPKSETTVEKIEVITLMFGEKDYPNGMEVNSSKLLPITDAAGKEVAQMKFVADYNDYYKVVGTIYGDALTAEGVYTIVIPEGHIWEFENKNKLVPEIKLTYTIGGGSGESNYGALPVSIDPADGSTVESLKSVTFTFSAEDYPNTMYYDYMQKAEVYDAAGNLVTVGGYAYGDGYSFLSISVQFEKEITEPGTYTVKVGEGHISEYNYDADGNLVENPKVCPAFEVTYIVGKEEPGPVAGAPIAVSPESGSTVESLSEITLSFGKDYYPGGVNYDFIAVPKVYNAEGEVVEVTASWAFDWSDFQNLILKLNPALTEAGTYTIKFPAGAVKDFEDMSITSPEFELVYIIEAGGSGESKLSSVVPAEGELNLADYGNVFRGISLNFSEALTMIADENLPTEKITVAINGEVKEEISLSKLKLDEMVEANNKVDLVFENKYSEAGEYIITIPGGWATFADGSVVEEIVLTYTVPVKEYTDDYITDPEEGEVESLTKIWIQLTGRDFAAKNSKTVLPSYEWYGKPYVIDDATGETVTQCYFYKEEDDCAFGLDLNTAIVTPGSYTVVIPQGQITYVQHQNPTAEEVNPEFRLHYTIVGSQPVAAPATVDPAEGVVESLSVINVTFTEAETVELNDESGVYPRIYKVTADGDVFECNGEFSVSGNVFTFTVYTDEETGELMAITEEGKYAFLIPAGLIKVDGVFTTEYRFEYQIGEAAALTITDPVPGSVVERLDKFTVVAPGAATLEENETRAKIQIASGEESICIVSVVSTEGNTIVLQAASPVTTSGEYSLIIPKGYFLIDGVMTEEEYTFDYTVENNDVPFVLPTVDPEEGVVEEFTQFVLTWENAAAVTTDDSLMMGTSGIAMYDAMDNKVSDFIGMPVGDNAIMLNFMGAAPAEAGEYRLVVPAGLITVDGAVNEEMTFVYQLLPAVDIEITIDKQGQVNSVDTFVLTFSPCEESVEINTECESSVALWTVGYPEEMIAYYEVTIDGATAKLELTIDADSVEDGDYTILVPAEYFIVDGQVCDGETFNVTLEKTGIYGIEADAKGLDVYSVSGILVLRDAKATDLKNLQKGIYIVNGKKILVR